MGEGTLFILLGSLGVVALCLVAVILGTRMLRLAGHPEGFLIESAALFVSAFGVSGAISIWLAFFPPQAYERWLVRAPAS